MKSLSFLISYMKYYRTFDCDYVHSIYPLYLSTGAQVARRASWCIVAKAFPP